MLNYLETPNPINVDAAYTDWRNQFMLQRLHLGMILAVISLSTFVALNVARYPNLEWRWLLSNFTQGLALLPCLILLYLPIGRQYPSLIFLLFAWTMTLIPQYWALHYGVVHIDFVTWTLVFLAQATLIPVRWKLHVLSQLGLFCCFALIQTFFSVNLLPQIQDSEPIIMYLYLFWFCVICDIAVSLYERLQRAEFAARAYLQSEQEKTERLLLNILPTSIAQRLKHGYSIIADNFTEVTVLFADIVGFTELSARVSPKELVELLNQVFSSFDKLVEQHQLEKIKTIGDAYMVVAGLPNPCQDHAKKIANLALDMQKAIDEFNLQQQHNLAIRVGVHMGPVVAGVIGIRKFAYDLWGDTVNTASRMESHGIAGHIQVSAEVYHTLKEQYRFVERGKIYVKGKGEMTTYLLRSRLGEHSNY